MDQQESSGIESRQAVQVAEQPGQADDATIELVKRILRAIERMHGRIGKLLIADFLAGTESSKVKSLRLQRLPEFGMLAQFKKKEIVQILDAMLQTAVLEQKEMNANRPTVFLAPAGEALVGQSQAVPSLVVQALNPKKQKVKVAAKEMPPKETSEPKVRVEKEQTRKSFDRPGLFVADDLDESTVTAISSDSRRLAADPSDWRWTSKLAERGFSLAEIVRIRRLALSEVVQDLLIAQRENGLKLGAQFFDRRTESAIQAFHLNGSRSDDVKIRLDGEELPLRQLSELWAGKLPAAT